MFWNQSYVDLISPNSCVVLDFDIIWTTISCHTLVCFIGLLGVFVQIVSRLVLERFCMYILYLILYGMLVFLVPIYKGYSPRRLQVVKLRHVLGAPNLVMGVHPKDWCKGLRNPP